MTWHLGVIEREADKTLHAWSVFEVPFDGPDRPWTWHLVGWRVEGGRGQVSSPVVMLDPVARKALTRSGRVHDLGARPGLNADAFATWGRWKSEHSITTEQDVTAEMLDLLHSR